MKNLFIVFALLFTISVVYADGGNNNEPTEAQTASAAATTTVNGNVVDFNNGESLAGAEVRIKGTDMVTYTDFDGKFKFENLKAGTYTLVITYISYKNSLVENMVVKTTEDNTLEVQLMPENN
jgi:hypothetical protein